MSTTVINPNAKPLTRKLGATASTDPLAQEIARLREENARLTKAVEAKQSNAVSMKVSESGCVSVYGLGRYPATYRAATKDGQLWTGSQWERITTLGGGDGGKLKAFVLANEALIRQRTAAHNAKKAATGTAADDESGAL